MLIVLYKILIFLIYNPSFATSLFITSCRILGQILLESVFIRHGLGSSFLWMGGSGIIKTSLTAEKMEEIVQDIFGKSDYGVVRYLEELPPIPEISPKNP